MGLLKTTLIPAVLLFSWYTSANVVELPFVQQNKNVYSVDADGADVEYNTIASVTLTELEDVVATDAPDANYDKDLGTVIMTIEKLMALGQKIYAIIEKGKPVVNTSFMKPLSVIPKSNDPNSTFYEMENWSAPRVRKYKVDYKNLYGMTVISFTFGVHYQSGGTYNGTGAYLTGVTVKASNVAVSWGFNFNATSEVMSIANRGSSENPVAGATLEIDYKASSILREIHSHAAFHVTGKGELTLL